MSTKRFRFAFSFAGEKRDFVAKVAAILAQRFGEDKILYDKCHKAEFSRSDLAFYLPDLYGKEADLVVAVFCPDYDKKEWCGRGSPPRPYPTPGARWRSTPASARPTSKPPARPLRKARLERLCGDSQ